METAKNSTLIVPAVFAPYVPAALMRLGYLRPAVQIREGIDGDAKILSFSVPDEDVAVLRAEIQYQLYREKILTETRSQRQALYDALARPEAF